MYTELKKQVDKWIKKIKCLFCRVSDIEEILEQNGLTTSTTTTTSTSTTTTTTTP